MCFRKDSLLQGISYIDIEASNTYGMKKSLKIPRGNQNQSTEEGQATQWPKDTKG